MIEGLDSILNEIKELEQKKTKLIKEKGKDLIMDVLVKHPSVEALVWDQYTPRFNDGDPCVFGAEDIYFALKDRNALLEYHIANGGSEEDYEEPEDWREALNSGLHPEECLFSTWDGDQVLKDIIDSIRTLRSMGNDFFYELFGDDKRIIVTREGFEVEYREPPY